MYVYMYPYYTPTTYVLLPLRCMYVLLPLHTCYIYIVDVHGACLYLHVPCTCLLVAACILYIPVCMRARAAGKFVSSAKLVL